MARILTLGITVFDLVLAVDRMPEGEGKHYAYDRREVVGGIAANAALAIRKLGGEAMLATRLGDDPAGDLIVKRLTDAGVDTSLVEWINGARTSASAIIVDRAGERMLINHADAALFRGQPDYAEVSFDAAMVDTRWPEGALEALARARVLGVPGLVDFDRMAERLATEMLRAASHVAFASQGLRGLTGVSDPAEGLAEAARLTDAWLCVTAGASGIWWQKDGQIAHMPAFEVAAVDTLGAGDVFHGALALALAEGQEIEAALRLASAAAAIKCMTFGGGSGMPTRAAVQRFLQERQA